MKIVFILTTTLVSLSANANLLLNGSFEDSNGSLPPWYSQVSSSGIALGDSYAPPGAQDGAHDVVIWTPKPGGTLSQDFTLSLSGIYRLTWWDNTAHNPDLTGSAWTSPYSVAIGSQVYEFDAREGGVPRSNGQWVRRIADFTLGVGPETLTFTTKVHSTGFNLFLDNVSLDYVTPVPEPTTLLSGALCLLAAIAPIVRKKAGTKGLNP